MTAAEIVKLALAGVGALGLWTAWSVLRPPRTCRMCHGTGAWRLPLGRPSCPGCHGTGQWLPLPVRVIVRLRRRAAPSGDTTS